jgi:hypothetical protein
VVVDKRACFVDFLCSLKGCAVRAVAEAICAGHTVRAKGKACMPTCMCRAVL